MFTPHVFCMHHCTLVCTIGPDHCDQMARFDIILFWSFVSDDKIHSTDRTAIKQTIVGLMLKSPEQIQKQLSDAISLIGKSK